MKQSHHLIFSYFFFKAEFQSKMAEGEKQKKRKRPVFQKKIKKSTIVDQTISKLQEEYTRVSFFSSVLFAAV